MATERYSGNPEPLAERLQAVQAAIAAAARAAGRRAEEITLIGVSKFFPAELALAAVRCGLCDLGENRVQEMLAKIDALALAGEHPRWHLIGTLQKNKVRLVIGRTSLIHSVDSLALIQEIGWRSRQQNRMTDILLQVNTAAEETKHGFDPVELNAAAELAAAEPGICLRGLMAMAPLVGDPRDALPVFSRTQDLFRQMADALGRPAGLDILSMGMSHDFIQAIACGATHVRIGSAIFGTRTEPPV